LPEAQSDRFLLKVKISYPDRDEEHEILRLVSGGGLAPEPVATEADLDRCRLAARQVRMEPVVESYVVDLVRATRDPASVGLAELDRIIDFGASPRATLALATTARSHAVLVEGRPYVTPDDVKAMAHDVLRHRILLSYEAEADGLTVDDVITRVIEQVRTP
jgi:MoxR-like ATPase